WPTSMPLSDPPLMVTRSPGRNMCRVEASWPPVTISDGAGASKASVGAHASSMMSAGRCVPAGADPVWASTAPPAATRAAVSKTGIERPELRISLLGFPPLPGRAASRPDKQRCLGRPLRGLLRRAASPKLLRGQRFELLAGIDQILAALEFLDQPVVVRDGFCFLFGL